MAVRPESSSTATLATTYATAGSGDWITTLSRADANGVAMPVLERLVAGRDAVSDEHADPGLAESSGAGRAHSNAARARAVNEYLAAELRRRRSRFEQFDLDLALVDELLTDRDIPYAVIKTNVDHAFRPWDINVLVAERHWPRVEERLIDHGWKRTTLLAHPLARTEPGKRLYEHPIRHPVHLHRAVSWNGVTYLSGDTVLDSRVRADGISYPAPVVDAVIHCAHSVFENFSLDLSQALAISRSLGADASDGERQDRGRELAVSNGWPVGFDLASATAIDVVERVTDAPTTVTLPVEYDVRSLALAWGQHARHSGSWIELPLNVVLRTVK